MTKITESKWIMNNVTSFGLTLTAAYIGAQIGNQCIDWYVSNERNPVTKEHYKTIGFYGGGIIGALLFQKANLNYIISDKVSQFLAQKLESCTKKLTHLSHKIYPSSPNISQTLGFDLADISKQAKEFAYEYSKKSSEKNKGLFKYIKNKINYWTGRNNDLYDYINNVINNKKFKKILKSF